VFARFQSANIKPMKSFKPILLLSVYYAFLFVSVALILNHLPESREYFPVGGVEKISSGMDEFMSGKAVPLDYEPIGHAIGFSMALLGVLLLMLPVAWVYMGARRRKGREQSFIMTIILLPVVVAGIVLIVQNSLALAFSLAGIVAGVRFRLTLDDTLDAIYIFVAIGAGLAAGTEALEIAVVVTMFFNYVILVFWELDYGQDVSVDHWFTKTWMNKGEVSPKETIAEDIDSHQ